MEKEVLKKMVEDNKHLYLTIYTSMVKSRNVHGIEYLNCSTKPYEDRERGIIVYNIEYFGPSLVMRKIITNNKGDIVIRYKHIPYEKIVKVEFYD